jgi:transcriptional regulator with XRE-family HTH domain
MLCLVTFSLKKEMKMTQRDMAGILNVDVKTLRNWKRNKPALYKKIMQGFMFDEVIRETEEHHERLKKLADKSTNS